MRHHGTLHADLLQGETQPWHFASDGPHRPLWFNPVRFRRGQQFFFVHFIACLQSFLFAIVCGFNVRRLAIPLLLTGRSDTPEKAVHRYLETIRYLLLWFHDDVFETGSAAHACLQRVNRLHAAAAEMMHRHQKDYPGQYFTQYDMSLVQYAFINIVLLYPAEMGVRCDAEDLLGYMHFWRVIGDALGVTPRWNLCTEEELYIVSGKCKAIEAMVSIPAILEFPNDLQLLADVFLEGFRDYIPFFPFTKASIILFALGVMRKHADYHVPASPIHLTVTFKDRAFCFFHHVIFRLCYLLPRWLSDKMNRMAADLMMQRMGIVGRANDMWR